MTTVFADEIMPRAKHFSVKTFGLAADARFLDSWRLVGRGVCPDYIDEMVQLCQGAELQIHVGRDNVECIRW
jgi:hypothetical protein